MYNNWNYWSYKKIARYSTMNPHNNNGFNRQYMTLAIKDLKLASVSQPKKFTLQQKINGQSLQNIVYQNVHLSHI